VFVEKPMLVEEREKSWVTALKYFAHGVILAGLTLAFLVLWAFITAILVIIGFVLGLLLGLALLFVGFGAINTIITNCLWFPAEVEFSTLEDVFRLFLHGLALAVASLIVVGLLVWPPSSLLRAAFPEAKLFISVANFIIASFLNGYIGKAVAKFFIER